MAAMPQALAASPNIEWFTCRPVGALQVISVNARGVFLCLKHQIPLMLETAEGQGAIVINSSVAGWVKQIELEHTGRYAHHIVIMRITSHKVLAMVHGQCTPFLWFPVPCPTWAAGQPVFESLAPLLLGQFANLAGPATATAC